jgi:hypothetical protein
MKQMTEAETISVITGPFSGGEEEESRKYSDI